MKRKIFSLALASTLVLGSASALADSVANVPFVNGYAVEGEELNEFRPDSEVKRCEIAKIAAEAYSIAKADPNFPDVDADHWAAQFIGGLQAAKVVEGDPDGNFRPEDSLTRAEFSAIVKRAAGDKLTDKEEEKDFNDTEGHWAEGIIDDLSKAEVVKGYEDGSFKPENKVTRAEAVAMVLRSLGRSIDPDIAQKVENPFSDVKEGAWYLNDVLGAATEYDYETKEDGKENIPVAVDTKVISSVEVPAQAFETDSDKDIKIKVNGSDENYDLKEGIANGYSFEFVQLDSDDNQVEEDASILEGGTNDNGKLKADDKEIDDYTIEVRVYKDNGNEFVTKARGTISIVDGVANKTEAIDTVEFKETNSEAKVNEENNKVVKGETIEVSKLLVDIDGKKGVDISATDKFEVESSNELVLEVDDDNLITAKKIGKATITVKVGSVSKDIEIEVVDKERVPTTIEEVGEVKLAQNGQKTIEVKVLDQYGAEIKAPFDDDMVTPEFSTDLESVEPKSGKNQLTIKAKDKNFDGYVFLKTENADGEVVELGRIKVTVGEQVGAGDYKLEPQTGKDLIIDLSDDEDIELELVLMEYDDDGKAVKSVDIASLASSDEDVVKIVDNKTVAGEKAGKATITAVYNNKTYTAEVEVVGEKKEDANITEVTFKDPALNIKKVYELKDFVSKEDIKHGVSSIEDVVTDASGNLSVGGKAIGTISITGSEAVSYDTEDLDKSKVVDMTGEGKEKTIAITFNDTDGKEIARKVFNLDTTK